jgi:Zn-finger nucleic acid-binding protein
MNCPNCGAAMELKEGRDYFVCAYCTTFHFPKEAPESADGVTALGGECDLNCPVCEKRLTPGVIERQRVYYCTTCRGVLTTNGSFGAIVKGRRAKYAGLDVFPVPFQPEELRRALRCPKCGGALDAHPYYGPGNVAVDTCPRCFLIWLDHGEIGKIEKAPGHRGNQPRE